MNDSILLIKQFCMNKRKSVEVTDCRKSLRAGSTNGRTVLLSRYIFFYKTSIYKKGKDILCRTMR